MADNLCQKAIKLESSRTIHRCCDKYEWANEHFPSLAFFHGYHSTVVIGWTSWDRWIKVSNRKEGRRWVFHFFWSCSVPTSSVMPTKALRSETFTCLFLAARVQWWSQRKMAAPRIKACIQHKSWTFFIFSCLLSYYTEGKIITG